METPPFSVYYLAFPGYNIIVDEVGINRRSFLFLLISGGLALAVGGFTALFAKRRPEDKAPQIRMKKAAYWRRVS